MRPLGKITLILAFCLCSLFAWNSPRAYGEQKEGVKTFQDRHLLFKWEYDLSREKEVAVKGMVKNINGFKFESVRVSITGLDPEEKRLNTKLQPLLDLEINESDEFEIIVPRDGREKSFLFTYEYKFYLDGKAPIASPSGPNSMIGWFQDSPDPAAVPKMVMDPPPYRKNK